MNGCDFFPGWLSRWDVLCNDAAWESEMVDGDVPYDLTGTVFYWVCLQAELDNYGCLDSELL